MEIRAGSELLLPVKVLCTTDAMDTHYRDNSRLDERALVVNAPLAVCEAAGTRFCVPVTHLVDSETVVTAHLVANEATIVAKSDLG